MFLCVWKLPASGQKLWQWACHFWGKVSEEKQGCAGQLNCPGFWEASLVVLLKLQQGSSSVPAQQAQFPVTTHKKREGKKKPQVLPFSFAQAAAGRGGQLLCWGPAFPIPTGPRAWAELSSSHGWAWEIKSGVMVLASSRAAVHTSSWHLPLAHWIYCPLCLLYNRNQIFFPPTFMGVKVDIMIIFFF